MTDYFRQFVVPDSRLIDRDGYLVDGINLSIKDLQERAKELEIEFDFQTLEVFFDKSINQYPSRVVIKISTK